MIKECILVLVLICLIKPSFCNNLRNISVKNICIFLGIYLFLKIFTTRENFNTFIIKYPFGVNLNKENRITDKYDYDHAIKSFKKRSQGMGQVSASASEVNKWKCKNSIDTINTQIGDGRGGFCPFYKIDNVDEVIKGESIIMKDVDNPCYKVKINPSCVANTVKDNDKTFLKLFPKFSEKSITCQLQMIVEKIN